MEITTTGNIRHDLWNSLGKLWKINKQGCSNLQYMQGLYKVSLGNTTHHLSTRSVSLQVPVSVHQILDYNSELSVSELRQLFQAL